jgi:type II secretory pathway pseudopilin PulG
MSPATNTQHLQPVRRRRRLAFSLIELSFAVAVILIGCTAVFSALTRVQRNAIVNRAHTNSFNILRNVLDQAMQHGWSTLESPTNPQLPSADPTLESERLKPGPKEILKPTIAGTASAFIPNPGDPGSGVAKNATVAGDPNWKRWSMYNAADVTTIPNPDVTAAAVYEDYKNPEKNILGRIYRKVQYVEDDRTLVWITIRIEYTYRGTDYAHNLCGLRAAD